MPALARGEANSTPKLNWFITVNGVLADATLVEFRVLDISAGLPGTQVFPTTPDTYHRVDNTSGHFATGSYYAYDDDEGDGWRVPSDEDLGTHRIEWRWQLNPSYQVQLGQEDFEVTAAPSASPGTYISVQDIRDEGITVEMAGDVRVQTYIEVWQAFLERACRQWFNERALVLKADGTDSDTLHFGVPIITVEYVKLNNDTTALDANYYRVYNSRTYPDDRRNPRIKLVSCDEYADIYTAPISAGRMKFRKGRQNQEIKGTFGFIEADGSTPAMIKRALTLLVIEKLTKPPYVADPSLVPPPPPLITGIVLEEVTDNHSLKYAQAGGALTPRAPGLAGITSNQEILDIIRLYRAPIGVATPAHASYS